MFKKIFSTSLERQPYRRAAQIGAFDVMGYDVDKLLEFVPGYDFHDYANEEFIDIALDKGYLIYEKVKDFPEDSDFRRYDGCILLSQLVALEKIVELNKVSILVEDDAVFKISYEELKGKLQLLYRLLHEPPEIVMLRYYGESADCRKRPVVPGTDGFFVKGAIANNALANVFSPVGAARILDYHRQPENQIYSLECCLQIPFGDVEGMYSVSAPYDVTSVSPLQGGSVQSLYEVTSAGRTDKYLGFGNSLETNAARLRKFGLAKGASQ